MFMINRTIILYLEGVKGAVPLRFEPEDLVDQVPWPITSKFCSSPAERVIFGFIPIR